MGENQNIGTVLILRDEELLVESLVQIFRGENLHTKTFLSGKHMLTEQMPNGPVCLLARVRGDGKCGLQAYEQLKHLGLVIPVVFLAENSNIPLAVRAMRAGAEDFLAIPFNRRHLIDAVLRALNRSRRFLKNCDNLLELHRRAASVTPREREIIALVVGGMMNKQIADQLKIALVTVKVHRGSAMHKLGARSTAELVRIARVAGLWSGDGELPSVWFKDGNPYLGRPDRDPPS